MLATPCSNKFLLYWSISSCLISANFADWSIAVCAPAILSESVKLGFANVASNPVPFDGATIFTSKNGKSIREYVYSDLEQAYKSNSISVLSSQVINNPKQLTMMTGNEERPEPNSRIRFGLSALTNGRMNRISFWVMLYSPHGISYWSFDLSK